MQASIFLIMKMEEKSLATDPQPSDVQEKRRFFLLLLLVFYLPVILIWSGILSFSIRYYLLVFMTIAVAAYVALRGRDLAQLGFRRDTFRGSLIWNGLLSACLALILLGLYFAGLIRHPHMPAWSLFYVFYVFISSPFQEFLFRSVLFCEGRAAGITKPVHLITLSAVTYCFLHVIWHDIITLIVTFVMGIIWGVIYFKYSNFWGVTLSHAVLGVLSIAVGLI